MHGRAYFLEHELPKLSLVLIREIRVKKRLLEFY